MQQRVHVRRLCAAGHPGETALAVLCLWLVHCILAWDPHGTYSLRVSPCSACSCNACSRMHEQAEQLAPAEQASSQRLHIAAGALQMA